MGWIIAAIMIVLVVGLGLLFIGRSQAPAWALDQTIAYIDEKISSVRVVAGIVLVIIGGWFISIAFNYAALWYFLPVGLIVIFFGLLYLFLPGWLPLLSKIADQNVFSADEYVYAARKMIGIVLAVAAAGYIIYFTLLAKR
ncbi:MAG TPA: hypothetical protein VMT55_01955 [Candidatus Sulfotelmatobacter sp.]|nr:hypothetical protein [Candidatus Sulfotelmatobacter sp.]